MDPQRSLLELSLLSSSLSWDKRWDWDREDKVLRLNLSQVDWLVWSRLVSLVLLGAVATFAFPILYAYL